MRHQRQLWEKAFITPSVAREQTQAANQGVSSDVEIWLAGMQLTGLEPGHVQPSATQKGHEFVGTHALELAGIGAASHPLKRGTNAHCWGGHQADDHLTVATHLKFDLTVRVQACLFPHRLRYGDLAFAGDFLSAVFLLKW